MPRQEGRKQARLGLLALCRVEAPFARCSYPCLLCCATGHNRGIGGPRKFSAATCAWTFWQQTCWLFRVHVSCIL